ncbi:MAG: hypothetical protein U1E67_03340 [Hyphomicrobiales bacterium]
MRDVLHAGKPLLVRAFELAHGGECASTSLLRRQLKLEGYPEKEIAAHLHGKSLRTQLAGLLRNANNDARFAP